MTAAKKIIPKTQSLRERLSGAYELLDGIIRDEWVGHGPGGWDTPNNLPNPQHLIEKYWIEMLKASRESRTKYGADLPKEVREANLERAEVAGRFRVPSNPHFFPEMDAVVATVSQEHPAIAKAGEILTRQQAAVLLQVSMRQVDRLVKEQGLPAKHLNGPNSDVRFLRSEILEWMKSR